MQTAKNIVVTGGNDGVGKETVRGLYKDGHNLIFGSRNQERNESAAKNIMQEEGGTLKYFSLDLSKRKSIEEFVKNIKDNFGHIDILINNAGLVLNERAISELGIEMTYTINHFGHFYLTYLLFDMIEKSKQGRILNVSSIGHFSGEADLLDDLTFENNYSSMGVYKNSKLLNVIFTVGLRNLFEKKNLKHLKTASLHPGFVDTGFGLDNNMMKFYRCCCFCLRVNEETGATTSLHLCRIPFEQINNGEYYDDDTKQIEMNKLGRDPKLLNRLWEVSEKAYGIKFD